MLQKQQQMLNTILSNQSIQEKTISNIDLNQKVVIGDIKELKKLTVKPATPPVPVLAVSPPVTDPRNTAATTRRSERPPNPPPASQPPNATMAAIVSQSVSE